MSGITIHHATGCVVARAYQGDNDFRRVRDLLILTYAISPIEFNWEIRRWDGSRYHNKEPRWGAYWDGRVRLWETDAGQLVGVAHPDGEGELQLQVHPDHRHIDEEMLVWAEERIAKPNGDGQTREVEWFIFEYDALRQQLAEKRGFQRTERVGVVRRLRLGQKVFPRPKLPAGYTLRVPREHDESEYQAYSAPINAAFNRTFHSASEVHTFRTCSPSYRANLDLLAEAPYGTLAATVGVTYDEFNRRGIFEPVCTHPAHRRKGLARSLMFEALHRLRALGAAEATVGTGDMVPANRLYESVGFGEMYQGCLWRKV